MMDDFLAHTDVRPEAQKEFIKETGEALYSSPGDAEQVLRWIMDSIGRDSLACEISPRAPFLNSRYEVKPYEAKPRSEGGLICRIGTGRALSTHLPVVHMLYTIRLLP